jgi:hypothetical protein
MDLIVGSSSIPVVPDSNNSGNQAEHALRADLESFRAESLGWLPLDLGAYLHIGDERAVEVVITGAPQSGPAVLLLV